jgi:hypothetical protein
MNTARRTSSRGSGGQLIRRETQERRAALWGGVAVGRAAEDPLAAQVAVAACGEAARVAVAACGGSVAAGCADWAGEGVV